MDDRVQYWIDLADEDLSTAKWLISGNKFLHAAFHCQQAVEKSIKAVIARDLPDGDMPPKIHNLAKLASNASIMNKLSGEQKTLLKILNRFNIDARYPDYDTPSTPTKEICEKVVIDVEEFLCWIKKQL